MEERERARCRDREIREFKEFREFRESDHSEKISRRAAVLKVLKVLKVPEVLPKIEGVERKPQSGRPYKTLIDLTRPYRRQPHRQSR